MTLPRHVWVLLIPVVWSACGSRVIACDLMGIFFDRDVRSDQLFEQFRRISEKRDLDGWGVGFYTDRSVTIFKQPIPAAKSGLAQCLIDKRLLKSKILIAHLRAASVGKPSHRNTHPWTRELGGVEYVMAHVGGADKRVWPYVKFGRFKPSGENCAEHIFCHILSEIDRRGVISWDAEAFAWLHQTIAKLNEVQTTSLLLSDGTHLFAYSSTRTSWLSYVRREMPAADGDANGPHTAVGVIVARETHNLARPGEQWTKIPRGHLAVFKDGRLIYQSQPAQ
ncbi:MAG: class II glutamine amidotransferase [Phycisphaerae bacterium]|nr:class II glutamine amidotransferase [Phycisphaerae bacterium]